MSAFLLAVGVGAIAQVVIQIVPSLRDKDGRLLEPATVGGVAVGLPTMFLTGSLVTA
ncbi:hypothetical protein [Amycolatopsis japonica]|uniref:hypothetical protein n=1 Tax=Amycolatopsis japonica TaxID=208439 RepID=UPI00130D5DA0|nr:hypothetical protein [Amycolatopsis japonica]